MTRLLTTTVSARHNPFASHHVEAIAFRFASGDWESNLERLRAMNWRGAIVGNQGSGKTTLMLELKIWLSAESVTRTDIEYCFVSRNPEDRSEELDRLLDAASRGSILLLDGIERFGWFQRRRLLRHNPRGTRLVVTAHGPVGLPVWIHCRTDWPLMREVLGELIDSPDELLEQEARRLFELHRGNVREVLRGLYDRTSGFPA